MKLWELERELEQVAVFSNPKIQLEQYPTDAHLAAQMLYTVETTFSDIEGKSVLDLGSGCGMLSIASLFFNPSYNLAVDICSDAIQIMKDNLDRFDMDCDIIQADVESMKIYPYFDTVLMNPPFGTKKNAGIDMKFLQKGLSLGKVVYSMHKSSTREHIQRKCIEWNAKAVVVSKMKFKIPSMYKFHQKDVVFVDVDLWRIERKA